MLSELYEKLELWDFIETERSGSVLGSFYFHVSSIWLFWLLSYLFTTVLTD